MIRKSLFWGLTLVLVAALVSMMIRGRQIEKRQSAEPAELVRVAPPSATRVTNPDDLQILNSGMQLDRGMALHEIEIKNNGTVPYGDIQLQFVYLDQNGKVLLTKIRDLNRPVILPKTSLTVRATVEDIPASVKKFQVTVISADIIPSNSATAEQKPGQPGPD